MKKIYTLPYALVIAALNTASSYADVFTSGDLQYTTLDENTCEITKSFAGAADLVIPPKATDEATGKEYTVVSIKYGVFRSSSITSCVVPGTITKCGPMLFNSCRSLKSVTFEEGVEELGYSSFPSCSQLTQINLPTSLKVLGGEQYGNYGSAFTGCTALKSITIPSGITEVPDKTFEGCSALEEVVFEGEITSIGESAFYNCTALTSEFSFPALTSIGKNAFARCTSLKKTEIGGSLENLSEQAFYDSGLEDITLNEGIKTIGSQAFYNCKLKSVAFPASVTEIAAEAFKGCTALASVSCYSEVPPAAYTNTFDPDTYEFAPLRVPNSADAAYEAADCWNQFEERINISVGIEETVGNAISVKCIDGGISIEGTDATAEVWSVSGKLAARTSAREIRLPAGLYIVRVAGTNIKTIVR